jgi:hypothetical protein
MRWWEMECEREPKGANFRLPQPAHAATKPAHVSHHHP